MLPLIIGRLTLKYQPHCGYEAWLRYEPVTGGDFLRYRQDVPEHVVVAEPSAVLAGAKNELRRGLSGMLLRQSITSFTVEDQDAVVLDRIDSVAKLLPAFQMPKAAINAGGYVLQTVVCDDKRYLVVAGVDDAGTVTAVFDLLRRIAMRLPVDALDIVVSPQAPIRAINMWDNPDGSIERGYAGDSIFWENGHITHNLVRVRDYARLLASLGLNMSSINNVNADPRIITPETLREIAVVADIFREWGVRLLICVDFGSPQRIGGLDTFDPLDPNVIAYWDAVISRIYEYIPDMAGIIVKADSEGQKGPSAYGRSHVLT